MKALRQLIRRILLVINILLLLVFIFTCYAVPSLTPGEHWPLGLLGLAFPFLLFLVIAFILFWLFFHFRYIFFGLVAIAVCWPFVSVFFAFHPFSGRQTDADSTRLTVMSYNVRYFKNFDSTEAANKRLRSQMMDLITDQQPDILCLQEFYTSENPHDYDNKAYISEKMGLPYRYFSSDHNYKNNHSGVILFSRYPIVDAAKLDLLKNNGREAAIYADILWGNDTLRVFTAHLQSIYLTHEDMRNIEKIKQQQDSSLLASRKLASKLHRAFDKRGTQANVLSEKIKASPHPVLVCGDFNDPPNSYTYFRIKDGLKDAFLEKGIGIGRTFSKISPTLRIDYIFMDPTFRATSFYVLRKAYSDHFPIIAQIQRTAQ